MTAPKTDRRILRTRALLRQGLAELMQEKNAGDITVKELVAHANVNRSTFYLHYTDIDQMLASVEAELLERIEKKGVGIAYVTLHVGLGTFRPVMEDEITDHKMHSEWYSISEETAQRIRETKAAGHRVIAVGTTSCRTLEAVAAKYGEIKACSGNTSIFLYPGVQFHCIDGLITNFHLPESTLIMLVSAFLGREKTLHAYEVAVKERYRFFSFGDAMYIGDIR